MMTEMQIRANHPNGRSSLAFQSMAASVATAAETQTALMDAACQRVEENESDSRAAEERQDADKTASIEDRFVHMLQITPETAACNGN